MATPTDLDSFLEGLRSEGRQDSQGLFTLDTEKARLKLQRYQLADPHHYVLPLVASAHLQGARHIYVSTTASHTRLEWDGPGLPERDIKKLFSSLFSAARDDETLQVQELAVGVNAALGLDPLQLWLEAPGLDLCFTKTDERPNSRKRGMAVRVEHSRIRAMRRALRKQMRGSLPEDDVLASHCGFSGCRLEVNGRLLRAAFPGEGCLASALSVGWGSDEQLGRLQPAEGYVRQTESQHAHSLLLVLYASATSSFTIVVNGISYPQRDVELGLPGLYVLAVAPRMAKNLSSSEVVRNADYDALLTHLQEETDLLCDLVASHFEQMEDGRRQAALPALRRALGSATRRQDYRRATQLARTLLEWAEGTDGVAIEAFYCVMLLYHCTGQDKKYSEALPSLLSRCESRWRVRARRIPRSEGTLLCQAYWFDGPRDKVEALYLFFLAIEERMLGPEATLTLARMESLRRTYELWGWKKKAEPLARHLHGNLDRTVLPVLEDNFTRYAKKETPPGD